MASVNSTGTSVVNGSLPTKPPVYLDPTNPKLAPDAMGPAPTKDSGVSSTVRDAASHQLDAAYTQLNAATQALSPKDKQNLRAMQEVARFEAREGMNQHPPKYIDADALVLQKANNFAASRPDLKDFKAAVGNYTASFTNAREVGAPMSNKEHPAYINPADKDLPSPEVAADRLQKSHDQLGSVLQGLPPGARQQLGALRQQVAQEARAHAQRGEPFDADAAMGKAIIQTCAQSQGPVARSLMSATQDYLVQFFNAREVGVPLSEGAHPMSFH